MKLTTEILEACYRAGAFPMADAFGRIEFYRSDPRSVLEFEDLHVPRSLGRVIRKGTFEVRVDEDFDGVIRACADREETWISPEIIDAYVQAAPRRQGPQRRGVRGWGSRRRTLRGHHWRGVHGRVDVHPHEGRFQSLLRIPGGPAAERGYELLDCQIQNPHLARLGAREIPEQEYLRRLQHALTLECSFA